MKKVFTISLCWMLCQCLWAEADSTQAASGDGTLKLNRRFMKSLEQAFEMVPSAVDVPRKDELTREQLHEWVGKPQADTAVRTQEKFTPEYFAYKCYLKEFCIPVSDSLRIRITGLPSGSPLSTGNWDFCHGLSMLFSKKYRQRAKSQRLAASHRKEMDLLYPLAEGDVMREADTGNRSTWEKPDWLKGALRP